jgi:TonB family protein
MNASPEFWKKCEGRVIAEKFPLQNVLGESDHSAVFLTELGGNSSQRAAIKLIPAENLESENLGEEAQLARWASIAKLSHRHLLRVFEWGRCQIDGKRFLYVVMEYADENLAQVLPIRPLSPAEVSEMLPPTAETLSFLHQAGFVHGRIKPSNIMAVDNQLKISADGLRKIGERGGAGTTAYDAPERAATGLSPAADVWALGATLVTVLTQREPELKRGKDGEVAIPYIPQPFYGIAQMCLRADPQQRGTMNKILGKSRLPEPLATPEIEKSAWSKRRNIWLILPVVAVALLLAVLFGRSSHQPPVPPAETHPTESATAPVNAPATQSPAPFSDKAKPAATEIARGSVLQRALPDISRSAQNTITGRVKVSVQVSVDTSGTVSQAKLVSAGPSRYFANEALTAARRWKFNAPQVDGQPSPSEWILRFQFGRTSTQVFPTEIKP